MVSAGACGRREEVDGDVGWVLAPQRYLLTVGVILSGSFDSTVRIWDALSGACLHHLKRHVEPIYSVSFHPTSLYLAVGSFDQTISLWSVEDGQLLRSYEGQSGIFDVAWNPTGDRISVCFADRKVSLVGKATFARVLTETHPH